MEATIQKKFTVLQLDADLINRLKEIAKAQHRSLNNFIEGILFDVAYQTPNQETLEAIEEAKSGKLQNTPPIDLTSPETMFKSMGI